MYTLDRSKVLAIIESLFQKEPGSVINSPYLIQYVLMRLKVSASEYHLAADEVYKAIVALSKDKTLTIKRGRDGGVMWNRPLFSKEERKRLRATRGPGRYHYKSARDRENASLVMRLLASLEATEKRLQKYETPSV